MSSFDSLSEPGRMVLPVRRDERATVHPLPFNGDDVRLVEGLLRGERAATIYFYNAHADRVRALIFRILGSDLELEDTLHDTFVRALESIGSLRDPRALRPWLIGVAVYTARSRIQARRRRRWLSFMAPEALPQPAHSDPAPEVGEALRAVSKILERIPTDDRIAVVLRLAERMTASEAAAATRVSLSTFKRRFARGEALFRQLASAEPALASWFERGNADER
ncbi:MAG: RNA polymerase sigma factor [Polyangiaceae bacterium]